MENIFLAPPKPQVYSYLGPTEYPTVLYPWAKVYTYAYSLKRGRFIVCNTFGVAIGAVHFWDLAKPHDSYRIRWIFILLGLLLHLPLEGNKALSF